MEANCLGCGETFRYDSGCCPECGWDPEEFRERGRHGLEKSGHGEPDDDGSSGPPPGPGGLTGV